MNIRPFDIINTESEIPDELTDILVDVGLARKKLEVNETRDIFNAAGAGIKEVAEQVSDIMKRGESESARLKACEIAMEVQGVLKSLDEKQIPEININIIGDNSKSIINLILPD